MIKNIAQKIARKNGNDRRLRGHNRPIEKPKGSQAERLLELVDQHAVLWHGADHEPWATINVGRHTENWPVNSIQFRRWLSGLFHDQTGQIVGDSAIRSALEIIEFHATLGPAHKLHVRIAKQLDKIYIDLGSRQWDAVEISKDGWQVISSPPVKFRRDENMGALPSPQVGSSEQLKELLATTPDNMILILGHMLDCLKGSGPYLILCVTGEQSSGKSSLCRQIKNIIDPVQAAPLASLPRGEHNLGVHANAEFVLAYDNVSRLPQWMSDAFCRVSTGGGIKSRALYTSNHQNVIEVCRPILLNGIPDFAEAQDFVSRALFVEQPRLHNKQRKDEQTLAALLEKRLPQILGRLFDMVATGLRNWSGTRLTDLPRMADSVRWISACGFDEFLPVYHANQESALSRAIEQSPTAKAVGLLMSGRDAWEGSADALLRCLRHHATMEHFNNSIPKNVSSLGQLIKRDAAGLRQIYGIEVSYRQSGCGWRYSIVRLKDEPSIVSEQDHQPKACQLLLDAAEQFGLDRNTCHEVFSNTPEAVLYENLDSKNLQKVLRSGSWHWKKLRNPSNGLRAALESVLTTMMTNGQDAGIDPTVHLTRLTPRRETPYRKAITRLRNSSIDD